MHLLVNASMLLLLPLTPPFADIRIHHLQPSNATKGQQVLWISQTFVPDWDYWDPTSWTRGYWILCFFHMQMAIVRFPRPYDVSQSNKSSLRFICWSTGSVPLFDWYRLIFFPIEPFGLTISKETWSWMWSQVTSQNPVFSRQTLNWHLIYRLQWWPDGQSCKPAQMKSQPMEDSRDKSRCSAPSQPNQKEGHCTLVFQPCPQIPLAW